MCGRYTITITDPDVIAATFDLETAPTDLVPRYNVAPTQHVPTIVKNQDGANELVMMRWGLVPSWAKDPAIGNRMINARSETLAEKPSFRAAYRKRRCLVVADGFYEWKKNNDGSKTPMYVRLRNGGLFGMAGLWERWKAPETGGVITTCTIITTEPNNIMRPLHHRMAVVLDRTDYNQWLDPQFGDTAYLQHLLQPYPGDDMIAYAVSPRVNNSRHDGPDLVNPIS